MTNGQPMNHEKIRKRNPFKSFILLGLTVGLIVISAGELTAQTETFIQASEASVDYESDKPLESSEQMLPFAEVIKDTEKIEGLFTVYRKKNNQEIYLEVKPEQLNKNFLCVITLNSGIGASPILRGMPLQDLMFYFQRIQNSLHFVVRNVNFRTEAGDPLQRSLDSSFSDSVLYSLPIKSIHPTRHTVLISLNDLLMSEQDLSQLNAYLPILLDSSYSKDSSKSYYGQTKAFPLNLEIESVYGFKSDNPTVSIPSLADSRGFYLRVRYSFSEIPMNNGYRPRLADERVGYFLTAYRDFSDRRNSPFVRYINRWHLEKKDPNSPLSPPKEPIVFWIENTVPLEYREAIREGVLMWNQAFEKAGFMNAIEVKQMPDDATWDPADVRYNTIRWSSSFNSWFLGLGPSRVNPLTGQILDADIILDANVIRIMKGDYQNFVQGPESPPNPPFERGGNYSRSSFNKLAGLSLCMGMEDSAMVSESAQVPEIFQSGSHLGGLFAQLRDKHDLCYGMESPQNFAVAAMSLSMRQNLLPSSPEMAEFIHQYLRFLTAHEVGHTLGLRHNFHGSTMLTPHELHDRTITREKGLTASVMDYLPVNLAPPGMEQGDYFSQVIGPYDEWAIEYGYKPIDAFSPEGEWRSLEAIAQRAVEPDLAYATDEDSFDILDPAANIFDLSSDILQYSQWQLENARDLWERLDRRYLLSADRYSEVRDQFDSLYFYYLRQVRNVILYVGGQSFNRIRPGDDRRRLPFEPIPVEKQRQALQMIQKYVFDENAFQFSPELLNKLAPDRWYHWGTRTLMFPLDYPIGNRIQYLQQVVLSSLFSPHRLMRLRDLELKTAPGESLTIPELFETLKQGIWTEVFNYKELTEISSTRRSLQRQHLELLAAMVLRQTSVPEDARTLAWYNLGQLDEALEKTLKKRQDDLDLATVAHLQETRARIEQILTAQLRSN
jgi:hypothetical protein